MIQIDIPMPTNCRYCPCISGFGKRCMVTEKEFNMDEFMDMHEHIHDGYRPKWCPLKEVEE